MYIDSSVVMSGRQGWAGEWEGGESGQWYKVSIKWEEMMLLRSTS